MVVDRTLLRPTRLLKSSIRHRVHYDKSVSHFTPQSLSNSLRLASASSPVHLLASAVMASPNNVFRGPESVAHYFDPERNPPLPLVEIPDRLNPYRQDRVRVYAKMLTSLPAQNVKSLPGTLTNL
jgi:hypothetical protein